MADLEVRVEDGALWITLNRPQVFNALTGEMADELAVLVEEATARDDVRVVVVTGTGDAFSAGADISGDAAHAQFDVTALDRANRIIRAITSLDKPVVAGVNGVAAGVGCSAALAADIVVAAESSSFLLAFARIGLMPDGAYLINVARGGLVDMDSLLAELRKARLTVALDVTDPLEPLPPDHELRRLPNALLTPHIAAGGIEMRRAIGAVAVEEVVRFCNGEQLENVVTREMLATMT